jgi:hypothetical protein
MNRHFGRAGGKGFFAIIQFPPGEPARHCLNLSFNDFSLFPRLCFSFSPFTERKSTPKNHCAISHADKISLEQQAKEPGNRGGATANSELFSRFRAKKNHEIPLSPPGSRTMMGKERGKSLFTIRLEAFAGGIQFRANKNLIRIRHKSLRPGMEELIVRVSRRRSRFITSLYARPGGRGGKGETIK